MLFLRKKKQQQAQAAFELSHTNLHFGISHRHTWKQRCNSTGFLFPRRSPPERWEQPRSSERANEMETLERESTFVPKAVTIFHWQ